MRRAGAEAEGESLAEVGIGGDVGWRWPAGLGTTFIRDTWMYFT
jgi:hypothetical protein